MEQLAFWLFWHIPNVEFRVINYLQSVVLICLWTVLLTIVLELKFCGKVWYVDTHILDVLCFTYNCSGGSRIFPMGVRQLPKVLFFFNFVPENCMKMKEFEPPVGASLAPPLDPPMNCETKVCLK